MNPFTQHWQAIEFAQTADGDFSYLCQFPGYIRKQTFRFAREISFDLMRGVKVLTPADYRRLEIVERTWKYIGA